MCSKHWIDSFTNEQGSVRKYLICILSDDLHVTANDQVNVFVSRVSNAVCEGFWQLCYLQVVMNVKHNEHFNQQQLIAALLSSNLFCDKLCCQIL